MAVDVEVGVLAANTKEAEEEKMKSKVRKKMAKAHAERKEMALKRVVSRPATREPRYHA